MNKATFMGELQRRLNDIPYSGREKAVEYYSEMIDDKIEEGMTEDEAVASTGDVDVIADRIRSEYRNNYHTPVPSRVNNYNSYNNYSYNANNYSEPQTQSGSCFKPWMLIILIFIPMLLPLIMVLLLFALALLILTAVLIFVCYVFTGALAVCGIYSVFSVMPNLFSGNEVYGLMLLGMGLFLMGLSVLMFFASNKLAGFVFKGLFKLITKPFRKKSSSISNGGVQV